MTAPDVLIWSAVVTSCSVPLVFAASPLLAKDSVSGDERPWNPTPQQHFIDGSVDNDLPMTRLAEMFSVNHFIVSQVNPHVAPFLAREGEETTTTLTSTSTSSSTSSSSSSSSSTSLAALAKDEALHRLQFMADVGVLPNLMTKARSVLSQKYSGDITILPAVPLGDLPRLLSNPTAAFMLRSALAGKHATWPKPRLTCASRSYVHVPQHRPALAPATTSALPARRPPTTSTPASPTPATPTPSRPPRRATRTRPTPSAPRTCM